jgi:hypothetical protein
VSDKKPDPITDESIDNLVTLVEAAEVMAKAMDITVSKALRYMLKSSQTFARMQQKGKDISTMFGPKGVQ